MAILQLHTMQTWFLVIYMYMFVDVCIHICLLILIYIKPIFYYSVPADKNIAFTASHKRDSTNSQFLHTTQQKYYTWRLCVCQMHSIASDSPAKKQLSPRDAIHTLIAILQLHSCIPLHRTAPPRSSWVQRCTAPVATQPRLHLMARANHEAGCLPVSLLHRCCVTGPRLHRINLPFMLSNLPKRRHSAKDRTALLQFSNALLIWNSSPFVHNMPQSSIHNFWQYEHTIATMRGARRIHAQVHAIFSNCGQHIAPYIANSLGKPGRRANQDCRRTMHHDLRHGCQRKLNCLHTKRWATSICCSEKNQKDPIATWFFLQNMTHKHLPSEQ